VPLSEPALAVLRKIAALPQSDAPDAALLPGSKGGKSSKPLSNVALLMLLRRIARCPDRARVPQLVLRLGRGTMGYQREVVEAALAHAIESKVKAAYRRGDLFEKRRRPMSDQATFCGRVAPVAGNVVAMRADARHGQRVVAFPLTSDRTPTM
jgi:hypothetical protein